jgi:hypothetical protein
MSRKPVLWVLGSLLAGGACSHERDEGLNGPVPVVLGGSQAGSPGSGGKAAGPTGKPGSGGRSASGGASGKGSGGAARATGGRESSASSGSGSASPGGCQPGTSRCDAVEPVLRTCEDSGSWRVETCPFVCRAGACSGDCQPGERRCDGMQPMRCNDLGAWITDGQACSVMCERGACAGTCTDGDKQCASSNTEQTCTDNLWGTPSPCAFTCIGGACGGECEPGATRCPSETEVQTCSSTGTWSARSACDFVCAEGVCTGECKPGEKRCAGADLEECAAGHWNRVTTCANACVDRGCAGECRPGAQRCRAAPNELEVCSAEGRWVASLCPGGGACSADACVTCLAGATLCASPTALKTCGANNEWGPPSACPNACVGTQCTGECAPGTRQCTGGGKPSQKTCNDQGVFVTSQCERGTSCLDGACDVFPKVIFVTSELFDGDLGGVAGADQKCQDLADRAELSGQFLALLNEPGRTIFDRFDGDGGPYQLTDGTVVANHFEELGNTLSALQLTELGSAPSAPDLDQLSEAGRAELVEKCRERRLESLVWCNAPVTGTGKSVCSDFSKSTGALGASFCDWSAPDWDRLCGATAPAEDEGYCKIRAPLVCIQR